MGLIHMEKITEIAKMVGYVVIGLIIIFGPFLMIAIGGLSYVNTLTDQGQRIYFMAMLFGIMIYAALSPNTLFSMFTRAWKEYVGFPGSSKEN